MPPGQGGGMAKGGEGILPNLLIFPRYNQEGGRKDASKIKNRRKQRKKSSKQRKKRSKKKKVRKKAKKNAKKRKKASKVRKKEGKRKKKKDKNEDNDGSEDEGEDSGGSGGDDEGGNDIFPEQDTSLRGFLVRLFRRVFFCFRSPTDVLHEKFKRLRGSTPLSSAEQSSDSQELSKKKNASTPNTSLAPFKSDRFGAKFLQKDEI
ncbi:hypothetical protein WR25_22602 [Diploscapter pachys]|uniref:Uncharacterized protein n=1 Tax=Diploscapter pachys TaxID=2018661 RepID=A0A2A2JPI4_9BILA|nr:hypothetical protein WR25_22602 [Diploscapter pachys]